MFDDGAGPALYAGGFFYVAGTGVAESVARWDGSSWSGLGFSIPGLVRALTVFDDGTGPGLYLGGSFSLPLGTGIFRWSGGSVASSLGNGVDTAVNVMTVFDDGGGPALYAGGTFTSAGGLPMSGIARWSCGSTISLTSTQPGGPGAPVHVNNTNLTAGREYHNLFSLDLCPGGVGTGPSFGACVVTPANLQAILSQILSPVGTAPFHVVAPSSYVSWGPFNVGPVTLHALCIDVTGGGAGAVSPVVRITIL